MLPMAVNADVAEISGIYYNLVSKTKQAEVTRNPNKYIGDVIIPETVTYMGSTYDVIGIEVIAFSECSELTSVSIPNNVKSIGNRAFSWCTSLSKVIIGSGVSFIGYEAFWNCNSLKKVIIRDIASWCNMNFEDLGRTTGANPLYYAKHLYSDEETEITDLVIPSGVNKIADYAFYYCESLASVSFPNSLTSIGRASFWKCSALKAISIPNSVTEIGEAAFRECSSLLSIVFPSNITAIGGFTCFGCTSLTGVTIPDNVTIIGHCSFENCHNIKFVNIPDKVTDIRYSAFRGCKGLITVNIPKCVTAIFDNAFSDCSELTNVYCYAETVPNTGATAFDGSYIDYATLHVPESAIESYKATVPWSGFQKIVSIESGGQLFDMTVKVDNAYGKVTYGTTDITDGQLTFNVKESSNVVLTLTPTAGFKVSKVMVNGVDKTTDVVNGQLTLSNITANMTVTVTFGSATDCATVTVGSQGVVTFSPVSDVDFTSVSGVKAYIGSGFNRKTGVLTMTRVYDVPAGEGLLLKGASGTYQIPYQQSYSIYSNLLKGVSSETNLSATTGGYVNYVLGSGSSGTGFYRVPASGTTLAAGHTYLQIPAETAAGSRALIISFDDEDEATAISDVERQNRESAVYDLQGRRVEQPRSGLYIRNGKKVIIK